MSNCRSRCMGQQHVNMSVRLNYHRFMDCEKWRKDFKLDELVRTFDYKEKPKVFEYYPQYYHKTDKVCTEVAVLQR